MQSVFNSFTYTDFKSEIKLKWHQRELVRQSKKPVTGGLVVGSSEDSSCTCCACEVLHGSFLLFGAVSNSTYLYRHCYIILLQWKVPWYSQLRSFSRRRPPPTKKRTVAMPVTKSVKRILPLVVAVFFIYFHWW